MASFIKMALDTGDTPDTTLIDTSNPLYGKFVATVAQASQFLGGSAIGQFVNIRSVQHKNRLCNQAAAMTMTLEPILGSMAPAAQMGASLMPGPAGMAAQSGLRQASAQGLQQLGGAGGQPAQQQPTPEQQQRVNSAMESVAKTGRGGLTF